MVTFGQQLEQKRLEKGGDRVTRTQRVIYSQKTSKERQRFASE